MPIPLGILAAAGVRAAGGSYELIETITVGSGGAASVTFSNLNTYSSTYQHLQLRVVMRGNNPNQWDTLRFTFNGDTGSNYAFHNLIGNGSSVTSGVATSQPRIQFDGFVGSSASSGIFASGVIDILDPYETNKNKTVRGITGRTADTQVGLHSGVWLSTAAISSIALTCFGGTLQQYSRFSIYGLKAS